jgi:hypothetical protein
MEGSVNNARVVESRKHSDLIGSGEKHPVLPGQILIKDQNQNMHRTWMADAMAGGVSPQAPSVPSAYMVFGKIHELTTKVTLLYAA